MTLALISCKNRKNSEEIFKEHYEINLSSCINSMVENGYDSVISHDKCSCYLNNLFLMDSNLVFKNNEEINKLIKENISKLERECK